jgi:type V secretory pathway adhesin AidA
MRRITGYAAAAVIGAFGIAGCAQQTSQSAAGGTSAAATGTGGTAGTPAGTASGTAPAATPSAAAQPSATAGSAACTAARQLTARVLTVTAADNGKTYCVGTGTVILVVLRGVPPQRWTAIHASSAALAPRADPRLMLMAGATGASFVAARPGSAAITSTRVPCHVPVSAGPPVGDGPAPSAQCGAVMVFKVTLGVS